MKKKQVIILILISINENSGGKFSVLILPMAKHIDSKNPLENPFFVLLLNNS